MLNREELIMIIEEYRLSHIQSETEVRSKLIVPLIEWLGYPSQFRAEEFPVYGNGGGTPLPAKHADFLLFDNVDFDNNRERKKNQQDWVSNHSLLVVEAKKSIRNEKELSAALEQVRSYALLLSAKYAVIASQEGIWITTSKVGYMSFINEFTWDELSDDDNMYQVRRVLGKEM